MKRLVTFHGCDHKAGTTMVSQSVAQYVAKTHKEMQILWIVCSSGSGEEYAEAVGESIEGLKGYLDNRLLHRQEVMEMCRKTENLFLLGGVSSLLDERYYFPETAAYLLDSLIPCFDLIVADCGNNVDNGLAVGALKYGGLNILVTRQSVISLKRIKALEGVYRQLQISFSHLVINGYCRENQVFPEEILRKLEFAESELHVLHQSKWGDTAEHQQKTLVDCGGKKFVKELSQLTEWILQQQGIGQQIRRRGVLWNSFT